MRRTNFSGIPARSSATIPKPPLCNTRSVVFKTCSSLRSLEFQFFLITSSVFGPRSSAFMLGADDRRRTTDNKPPHLTHKSLPKPTPAVAADSGSKLSLASIRTQVSSRRVAAAIAASSRLVLPEESGPQISDKHPRGIPPLIASTSAMPVESISGLGLTSSRDAGRTSINRFEEER